MKRKVNDYNFKNQRWVSLGFRKKHEFGRSHFAPIHIFSFGFFTLYFLKNQGIGVRHFMNNALVGIEAETAVLYRKELKRLTSKARKQAKKDQESEYKRLKEDYDRLSDQHLELRRKANALINLGYAIRNVKNMTEKQLKEIEKHL